MSTAKFKIWRGDANGGEFKEYTTELSEGMVVLDAVHQIQAEQAHDLAVRWNCKAGKCGSCSAEVNGQPKLMCMTRMGDLDTDRPITVEPLKAFPPMKDLVTDVSWNDEVKKRIKPFKPRNRTSRTAHGRCISPMWTGSRSSGSASSATCVRTYATSSESTTCTTSSSDPGS